MPARRPPRLCFVGAMSGEYANRVPTQGEAVARQLGAEGYDVFVVSTHSNRYLRIADIIATLLARRSTIDIQLIQLFSGPSFIVGDVAGRIGKLTGQKVVMQLRGGGLPQFFARHPTWSRRVLSRADRIVAPTRYLARAVEALGFDAQVIPNVIGMDAYDYVPRSELRPRMLWMRAFHPIYNPEMAVRAFARVRRRFPDATLTMGGPDMGSLRATVELARELCPDTAIRFVGFMKHDDKIREGAAHDIHLHTNRIDNMPVSVLEMAAMGLPIVATSVGGIPDLLEDGTTALLIASDDDEGMAEAVARLIAEPELGRRLSLGARALAESATWKHAGPLWTDLINDISTGDARRPSTPVDWERAECER